MLHRAREAWAVKAVSDGAIALRRKGPDGELLLVANLAGSLATDLGGLDTDLGGHPGTAPGHGAWNIMLHTEQPRFGGSGGEPVLRDGRLEVGDACAVLLARGPGH
jgi:hypothetical protein